MTPLRRTGETEIPIMGSCERGGPLVSPFSFEEVCQMIAGVNMSSRYAVASEDARELGGAGGRL